MKLASGRGITFSLVLLMPALLVSTANAQQDASKVMRIRSIKAHKVMTPQYDIKGGVAIGAKKAWLEITTEYDTAPDWIDELRFTYYIAVKGKEDGKQTVTMFQDTVSYVNIERGQNVKRHKSVMYLHPSTLKRYGSVEAVAVQVRYKGRLEATAMDPDTKTRWWEQYSPRQGYLLTRLETPFAMINFDDYEAIKGTDR